MAKKFVYFFGNGRAEGQAEMKGLLGGKGANLAEMTNIGLPVPPGFTISTEVCTYYYDNKKKYPKELRKEVQRSLQKMEKAVGMQFGDLRPSAGLGTFGGACLHAWYDGYHLKFGIE